MELETYPLTPEDTALVEKTRGYIAERYVKDEHFVGASGVTKDGTVISALNLAGSPRGIDECAEPGVLSQIIAGEHGDLATIVAVRHESETESYVVAPCGKCREFILRYAPDALIIVPDSSESLRKVPIDTLLPFRYKHHTQNTEPK